MWINSAGKVAEAVFRGQACGCACGLGQGEARVLFVMRGCEDGVWFNSAGQWLRQYSGDRCASAPKGLAWEKQERFLE